MPNYKLVLNILSSINGGLITGAALLQTLLGQDLTIKVVAILGICQIVISAITSSLSTQNSVISQVQGIPGVDKILINAQANPALAQMAMGADAPKIVPAPGSAAQVANIAKTVVNILLVAFVLSVFLAGAPDANAQTGTRIRQTTPQQGPVFTGDLPSDIKNGFKGDPNDPSKGVQLTGNLKKDAQAVWDKIVAASNADLKYASQLAANANTPSSAVRKQCWDEILATNEQANGLNLKDANGNPLPQPDPKLFTQIEQAAEVIDALSPQGKLYTACAGAAQLAQANVIQFISAAVGGVAGLAKLTPIPGL